VKINKKSYQLTDVKPFGKGERIEADASGFSLIELVMIIVLIGIVMAVVVPKLRNTTDFSLEGSASMIVADIRNAQELAMATHDDKNVVFTLNGASYTVETESDSVYRTVDLPTGVTITSADITFTFNPLGEPTAGGGSSVTISAGGNSKTVTVGSYTGRASTT
jgi:type II secretory pathway pseudopilin PulG